MTASDAAPTLADRILSRLGRVTSGGKLISEIDGLRFFAITPVIAFHVSQRMPHAEALRACHGLVETLRALAGVVFDKGFFGVDLFFVISGFILSIPFAGSHLFGNARPSLGKYFKRRLTRLEPPYLVSLLVCFAVLVLFFRHAARPLLPHLGASAIYMHELVYGREPTINSVLWSLEVEVQFYALAPLLTRLFRIERGWRRRLAIALLPTAVSAAKVAATMLATRIGLPALATLIDNLWLPTYLGYFCAGLMLADVYLTDWKTQPSLRAHWDLVGAAVALALVALVQRSPGVVLAAVGHRLAFPLLLLLLCMAAFRGPYLNRLVRNRWILTVGGMCYSIYLYHDVLIELILPAARRLTDSLVLQVALFELVAVVVAAVAFVAIEKPCMHKDWPARLAAAIKSARRRRSPAVSG